MKYLNVFDVKVNCTNPHTLLGVLEILLKKMNSSYVTFTNVHVVVSARKDPPLMEALENAHIVAPDGMPLVWLGRLKKCDIDRCSGPDVMKAMLRESEIKGYTHYFYGSTRRNLRLLESELKKSYPNLKIVGMYAPPFRELTETEDNEIVAEINKLSPDFIWVGLGAPKQEKWMLNHKDRINHGVMLGVGAAFDFLSGNVKRAPLWMQKSGLEWLYRLIQEPGRLWKRYLVTNLSFMCRLITKGVKIEEK